jgi:hypothetical protein
MTDNTKRGTDAAPTASAPSAAQDSSATSAKCPTCLGNDGDAPCAYPSEGKAGCLRDKRREAQDGTSANGSAEWRRAIRQLNEITPPAAHIAQPPAIGQQADSDEVLALHRKLAAETLRADQGWQRYEAKNRECLDLRAARSAHLSATNSGTEGVDTDDCAAFSDAVLFGTAPAPQAAPDDGVKLLRRLKRDLMHARLHMPDTLDTYRRACTSAECDIEEFLATQRGAA